MNFMGQRIVLSVLLDKNNAPITKISLEEAKSVRTLYPVCVCVGGGGGGGNLSM